MYLVEQIPCTFLCKFSVLCSQGFTKVLFLLRYPCRELSDITRCVHSIQTKITLKQSESLRLVSSRVLGAILGISVLEILHRSSTRVCKILIVGFSNTLVKHDISYNFVRQVLLTIEKCYNIINELIKVCNYSVAPTQSFAPILSFRNNDF